MKREAEEPLHELEEEINQAKKRQNGGDDGSAGEDQQKAGGETSQMESQPAGDGEQRLAPKVRVVMIIGYNGSDFCGSQKNPGVRTPEEELEKTLFKMNCISKFNFGDLKKIAWNRATRTDKSVHALQNVFSCKIHLAKQSRDEDGMEAFRVKLNETLVEQLGCDPRAPEIKVFTVIEVSNRFNAKNTTSHREYSYYLPTFLLASINEFYLGKLSTGLKPEEQVLKEEDITAKKVVNGIQIIRREANEADQRDGQENFAHRDISHLTNNPEFLKKLYGYRLSGELRERVHLTFKETFEGTQKYHNYTKDMKPDQNAANRFMMELSANDYLYVNQDTFEVTDGNDPRALEFVHFYLRGQSFLYN